MNRQLMKDTVGWGFVLWFVGYVLGILLFFIVPSYLIGWLLMPIGTALTLWVLLKKVKATAFQQYIWLAVVWTALAIVLDFFLLVKIFNPPDGYYKLDVYIYYSLTFALPLMIGWRKKI